MKPRFLSRLCAVLTLAIAAASAQTTHLFNLSTRGQVTAANLMITGFNIPAGADRTVLIRAAGPALTSLSVSGALTNPKLEVYNASGTKIYENDDWGSTAALSATFASVGAFPFTANSLDAAIVLTLPAGGYTAQISGVNATTGVTLVEVYDLSATTNYLVNLSTRGQVGTGSAVLIAGFNLSPTATTRRLLIRAVGPTLANFSLGGLLADPKLELYNSSGTKIAENDDWGTVSTAVGSAFSLNATTLASAFTKAGAFSYLGTTSKDSALLIDLPAGGYTAQVSGVASTTGLALVEIYDVTNAGITFTVTAPTITTQPSSLSVAAGASATFTVVASGNNGVVAYQWYKGATALAGATGASYTLSSAAAADAGSYSVVVSNSAGSVTSAAATLAVTTTAAGANTAAVVSAANTFLATLSTTQLTTAQKSWALASARQWSNLPAALSSRNGINWGSLSTAQKSAAAALISAALSTTGNTLWLGLQAADDYLNSIGGGSSYGNGNYYIACYGTPSTSSFWVLQLTGHHLTYNLSYNGTYASATPLFLGVEPKASFTLSGTTYDPMSAQRTAAADLIAGLASYPSALLSGTYSDILFGANGSGGIDNTYPKSYPTGTSGRGILYSALASADQEKVKAFIRSYVNTQASDVSTDLLNAYLGDTALASTYAAYSGTAGVTTRNSYLRVDGPRVWIEFSVQNGVIISGDIHYHTIWRDKLGDFGGNF